jgi:hypothetical protein
VDAFASFSTTAPVSSLSYLERLSRTIVNPLTVLSDQYGDYWGDVAGAYSRIDASAAHPGVANGSILGMVRRWTATAAGNIRILAQAQKAAAGGDGVGFQVKHNDVIVYGRAAITDTAAHLCNQVVTVAIGDTVDLLVNPGPGADINFDALTTFMAVYSTAAAITAADLDFTPPLFSLSDDFSGVQDQFGWKRLVRGPDGTETPLVYSGGAWSIPSIAWASISATYIFPPYYGLGNIGQTVARRTITEEDVGQLTVSGSVRRAQADGDGTAFHIVHRRSGALPDYRVYRLIAGGETHAFLQTFNVALGDMIDFEAAPAASGNINYDNLVVAVDGLVVTGQAVSAADANMDVPVSNVAADFPLIQGGAGYSFIYRDAAGVEHPMTLSGSTWVVAGLGYTAIGSNQMFPPHAAGSVVIKRFVWPAGAGPKAGITGTAARSAGGDGTLLAIVHTSGGTSETRVSRTIGSAGAAGTVAINQVFAIAVGDVIDLEVGPGAAGDINFDAVTFSNLIYANSSAALTAADV